MTQLILLAEKKEEKKEIKRRRRTRRRTTRTTRTRTTRTRTTRNRPKKNSGRHVFLTNKSNATERKSDRFLTKPSKEVMTHLHWRRKIPAALKWRGSQLRHQTKVMVSAFHHAVSTVARGYTAGSIYGKALWRWSRKPLLRLIRAALKCWLQTNEPRWMADTRPPWPGTILYPASHGREELIKCSWCRLRWQTSSLSCLQLGPGNQCERNTEVLSTALLSVGIQVRSSPST